MIKRIIILVLFAASLAVAAAPPERKVENNVIISERDPKVRIELPKSVHYIFVHLLDEQKRKELMIIYGEDLASTGFTVADLKKGGKAYDKWPAIEKSLVERAESRIKIEQTAKP